jgi:hypothetical protein
MRITRKTLLVVATSLFLLMLLGVVVVWLAIDPVMKRFLVAAVEQQTGLSATVEEFRFRPFSGEVQIRRMRLYQPATNGGALVMDIPEVFVALDLAAAETNRLQFRELRLDIAEANISKELADPAHWEHLTNPDFTNRTEVAFGGIDKLTLSIGTLRFPDPERPENLVDLPINLRNQTFTNLTATNLEAVAYFISIKAAASMMFQPSGGGLF